MRHEIFAPSDRAAARPIAAPAETRRMARIERIAAVGNAVVRCSIAAAVALLILIPGRVLAALIWS